MAISQQLLGNMKPHESGPAVTNEIGIIQLLFVSICPDCFTNTLTNSRCKPGTHGLLQHFIPLPLVSNCSSHMQ
jgi:hypothetical protein